MLCFLTANSAFSKATLCLAFICSVIVCSSGDRGAPQLPLKPVDCLLSEWSSWTRCDPCLMKRYRYATLSQPSEFGGESCDNHGRQVESCTPPSQYSCQRRAPLCQGFRCTTTGRCVLEDLRCNGDDDCGDGSDEQGCKKVHKACNQPTEEFYGIENLAKGVNIMNGKLEAVVLDNRYYAGGCLPHFIQDKRFRKPFNLQQYTIETKGKLDYKMEAFESKSEYLRSESKYTLSETSVSIGLKIPNVFEFDFKYNDHHYKKSAKKLRRYSGMRNKYVRVYSELGVARYALKSSNLMLHPEFLSRLNALPLEYTYGEYRQLYNDYGTHFVKEATLGGNFDYTLILNEEKLENEGYKLSDDKNCVNAGVKLGANIKGVYVSGGLSGGSCRSLLEESGEFKKTSDFLEDVIIVVRGGDSESVSRLAAKKLPDPSDMQLWGDAIFYNPEFLNRKLEPLFELVTGQDFSGANILKKNLKRALAEYMREVSSCQCSPCLNNGAPVLKGTRCVCVCPPGFKGVSCEITQRKTLAVDASWSCWSSWSTCTGRTRQRTRQCDNPAPTGGGMTCLGPQNESEDCI